MNPAADYIINQKEPFRSILLHLKAVIESVVPNVDMKYKWNIPCFYAGKQPICYLNVSPKKRYVDIAFWNSAHLTLHLDKMVTENRKVVKSLRYRTLEEIDQEVLVDVLQECYAQKHKGFYKR
ncbi:MAG: DUF1801 domain-containing protein [Muricauda sp.]|nr:DUF1801 domain-containing protein [Allomuricauda sp.]MBO6531930.1 DUF1801 domain-containing protein [Allomuricauda sp.]MBO6588605.1 DUF1801 domain-containing protein [Allomuricauda sp.]MBO6618256.1 DUF1801 domain-containing protein [Allomuricauda sp.]MBO6644143.1 DUF1801 domain-containing protein [Allomuricauda sp.]MBO6747027.1 DUF1801 domain-containing protein [Allomuricauda sp.]